MTEIKLYNTKSRKKEAFAPLDPENVRMYVCGPTVYDRAHIGNARPVIVFDVLYRLMRLVYGEAHVTYARNFTDVDDKINATAQGRKEAGAAGSLVELIHERADETIAWYLEDMAALGNLVPDKAPRATEFIAEMITMIKELIATGHAYEAEGHVLFDVTSYDRYGSLSGRSIDDMIAGARVEVAPYKRNPMDFVLWKPSSAELPGWDSPWGWGRPGWHIECSAMTKALFGERFDIHGGGLDLAFPHHENEKAQSCCEAGEDSFAQVWMHNEMLQVEGKKMSKSLGNFFSVRALLDQGYPGEVIRFVFLSTHYRKPMDWTQKKAREAETTLMNWRIWLSMLGPEFVVSNPHGEVGKKFLDTLADDLNVPGARATLSSVVKRLRAGDEQAGRELIGAMNLLGIDPNQDGKLLLLAQQHQGGAGDSSQYLENSKLIEHLVEARNEARKNKDYARADELRNGFDRAGLKILDSPQGTSVELLPNFDPAKLEALK
jgi:cysteinyl-tRNA synthetase